MLRAIFRRPGARRHRSRGRRTSETKAHIWIPFVSGIVGALLGGISQYYVTRSIETEKQLLQMQMSAYADFAKAQAAWQRANLAQDNKTADQQRDDAALKISDARFRVVIFSPPDVVNSVAAFLKEESSGTDDPCGNIAKTDINMYQNMRRQVLGTRSGQITDADIAMALWGCTLK